MAKRTVRITSQERDTASDAALVAFRSCCKAEVGYVDPKLPIGRLSDFDAGKLVGTTIAAWIITRSKQLVEEEIGDDHFYLATGEVPEPAELGRCSACLPALGDLIEKLGLTDHAIGTWREEDILLFVWTAADLVEKTRQVPLISRSLI